MYWSQARLETFWCLKAVTDQQQQQYLLWHSEK